MNTRAIIEQEGYRVEDLNERHQEVLTWLRYLADDFEQCFEYENDCEYGIIGDLKDEIARDVIEQVKTWLEIQIAEYQIGFAENEAQAVAGV